MILNFDSWIAQAKTKDSRERRQGMRDYVELLIDTGARPGKELMDLKWNGNPPLEPRGLEVEFFPKEEVLHEKVKIYG